MFTLVAFNEARTAATAIATLDATDDDHIIAAGDDIYVPKTNKIIGAYGGCGITAGTGVPTVAYLDSPSLRRVTRNELPMLHTFVAAPTPGVAQMFPTNPLPLDEGEALNALMTNTGAVALARGLVAVLLADAAILPVKGEIRTIFLTSVVAGTLGVWTSGALTLAYDLPAGRYQLVGARVLAGATAGIYRFIFPEQWARPGGVATRVITDPDIYAFRNGNLGVWGEFTHRALPRLEVLNIETVANPGVFMDIIKVG